MRKRKIENIKIIGAPKRTILIYFIEPRGPNSYDIGMDFHYSPANKNSDKHDVHTTYRASRLFGLATANKMSLEEHHEKILDFLKFSVNRLWTGGYIKKVPTENNLSLTVDHIIKEARKLKNIS